MTGGLFDVQQGDVVLHGGEWRRVHGRSMVGLYTDRGHVQPEIPLIYAPNQLRLPQPSQSWEQRVAETLDRPAEGGDAMNAAGYQWQGGTGEHDEALSRWLHEHMDINLNARSGGPIRADLDAALQPSTKPMILYRGVDSSTAVDQWTDAGYPATSADQSVALHYARQAPKGSRAVLRIRVPAGVGSAAIGQMPDMDNWQITDLEDSGEVLLQRGLRFTVVGGKPKPFSRGVVMIDVEVTP